MHLGTWFPDHTNVSHLVDKKMILNGFVHWSSQNQSFVDPRLLSMSVIFEWWSSHESGDLVRADFAKNGHADNCRCRAAGNRGLDTSIAFSKRMLSLRPFRTVPRRKSPVALFGRNGGHLGSLIRCIECRHLFLQQVAFASPSHDNNACWAGEVDWPIWKWTRLSYVVYVTVRLRSRIDSRVRLPSQHFAMSFQNSLGNKRGSIGRSRLN